MIINTVIIDIETLDTAPTAVILSIGAFAFDRFNLNGTIENIKNSSIEKDEGPYHLHYVCNLNDQLIFSKRTISQSTLNWWRDQSWSSIKPLFLGNRQPKLFETLTFLTRKINKWKEINTQIMFYFRGANFDPIILKNAFEEYRLSTPWKYNKIRDVRSYIDALKGTDTGYIDDFKPSFDYIQHNALHDAMKDAEQMCTTNN